MIVKPSSFSDSSSDTSSLLSPMSNSSAELKMSYDELPRHVSRIRTDHSTGKEIPYPELRSGTAEEWATKLEDAFELRFIPRSQWSDAAILFLTGSGEISMAMREHRSRRVTLGVQEWPWEEFKVDLYDTLVEIETRPSCFEKFQQDHPTVVTAAKVITGTGLVVAGGSVLAPSLVVATLNGIGFTATGVAAGSWATMIQGAVYGGATTGLFSTCQSIGATAVVASGSAITTSIGAVAAGASILGFGRKKKDDGKPPKPGNGNDAPSMPPTAPPPYQA